MILAGPREVSGPSEPSEPVAGAEPTKEARVGGRRREATNAPVSSRVCRDGIRQRQPAASSEEPATRLMQWVAGVGRHPRRVSKTRRASGDRGPVASGLGAPRLFICIHKQTTRACRGRWPVGWCRSAPCRALFMRPARSLGARGTQPHREPKRYRRQAARAGGRAGEETSEPVSPRACRHPFSDR